MSWNGFYPEHPCKKCGQMLKGQDSGYPAETYAGTYNGLCYKCTGSMPYLQKKWADGCQLWNFPPHLSSWRRDRETYFYHPLCTNEECEHGRVYVSRCFSFGGSYYINCDYCVAKYFKNKYRQYTYDHGVAVYKIAQKVFDRLVKKIEKSKKYDETTKEQMIAEIKETLQNRVKKLMIWAKIQEENLRPKLLFDTGNDILC